MGVVDSTKGAPYSKFLVMDCTGKKVVDHAFTLPEATTILADRADDGACFVLKILRTSEEANVVKAFKVNMRPPRYVEQAYATPPHVETEQEVPDEVAEAEMEEESEPEPEPPKRRRGGRRRPVPPKEKEEKKETKGRRAPPAQV